jgi:hypothetical protein
MSFPRPRPAPREIHLLGCDCPACEPHRPSRPRFRASTLSVSVQVLAGLALGQAAVVLYDWLAAGPGPFVVFGL